MDVNDFLKKLKGSYVFDNHEKWLKNIFEVVKKVNLYLEDDFFTNHFEHFEFSNDGIKKDNYFKFHQGMWHLHMMYFFLKNGFKLIKPAGKDDIAIDMGNFKIYIECTCPSWGRQNNYIGKTYIEMSKGYTEISKLYENFIEKSVYSINNKIEEQIEKRKRNQDGFYLVAINEGLLINGFDTLDSQRKGPKDRANDVMSRINNPILDGIIYGSISESSYCQIEDKMFGKLNNLDDQFIKVFKKFGWVCGE